MNAVGSATWRVDRTGPHVSHISTPGIVCLEKYHKPGRLLRALEELEANEIERGHCGFEVLKKEINSIVGKENRLGKDVYKLDVYAGAITSGRGVLFKIRAHRRG